MASLPGSKNFLVGNKAIIALIATQIALFISSKWFGLDFGQGWTVLIAVASVLLFAGCVAIGAVWRWWWGHRPQFGLLWLGLFVVAVGILLGWLMSEVRAAQQQAEIRRNIVNRGGMVEPVSGWSGPKGLLLPPSLDWKTDLFADYYRVNAPNPLGDSCELIPMLPRVRHLSLHGIEMADEQKRLARTLPNLRILHLEFPLMKDSDLESFETLDQLEVLGLAGYSVTDACLSSIVKLKGLEELGLQATSITGPGLGRLRELPRLRIIDLRGGDFTDDALKHLNGATIEKLTVYHKPFPPRAFSYLPGLPKLKSLTIDFADLHDEHVEVISGCHQLETLYLSENELTDRSLEHIAKLSRLKKLVLREDAITKEAIDAFRARRPDCVVEQ